jgi:hypothetical protein
MDLHEVLFELAHAIKVIFRLGYLPDNSDIVELSAAEYDAFRIQGGEVSQRVYWLPAKDGVEMTPDGRPQMSVLVESEIAKLRKGVSFLTGMAEKDGKHFSQDKELLEYAASCLPNIFSEGTPYARSRLQLVEHAGEAPLDAREEWLSFLAEALGEGTIQFKVTHGDSGKTENIVLPMVKRRVPKHTKKNQSKKKRR